MIDFILFPRNADGIIFSQSPRFFRSSWRRLHSASEATFRYNTQSSANRRTLESRAAFGRSLMKDRNRCGPRTVPCGTIVIVGPLSLSLARKEAEQMYFVKSGKLLNFRKKRRYHSM